LLVCVATVHQLQEMLRACEELLLEAQWESEASGTDRVYAERSNRIESVAACRDKNTSVLLTTTIPERGVTFPFIDVIVSNAGHSVFDEAALVQIAGRVGRRPEDPSGDVVFFHDGKTEAMVRSQQSIKEMNQLQKRIPYKGGR